VGEKGRKIGLKRDKEKELELEGEREGGKKKYIEG